MLTREAEWMHTTRVWTGLVLALAVWCSGLIGCGSVRTVRPEGRNVRLLQEEEPASIRTERRVWFWLWGGQRFSDDTPVTEIEQYNLKEVRVESYQTVLDTLLNCVCWVATFVCRTIAVEGNS